MNQPCASSCGMLKETPIRQIRCHAFIDSWSVVDCVGWAALDAVSKEQHVEVPGQFS